MVGIAEKDHIYTHDKRLFSVKQGGSKSGKIIGCATDYRVQSKVQDIANNCNPRILIHVEVYDDSVEITNPGRLLFDKNKFGKLSVARNPIIFDAFYRLGITEKYLFRYSQNS